MRNRPISITVDTQTINFIPVGSGSRVNIVENGVELCTTSAYKGVSTREMVNRLGDLLKTIRGSVVLH